MDQKIFYYHHYCFIMVSIHFATILTNRQWSTESPVEYIWRAKSARFYRRGTQESYFAFVAPHSLLNSSRFNGEKEKGGCTCAATTTREIECIKTQSSCCVQMAQCQVSWQAGEWKRKTSGSDKYLSYQISLQLPEECNFQQQCCQWVWIQSHRIFR